MNKNIKICFMGTPRFGEIVLQKLISEYTVVLVVTQPDKKGKRGKSLIESPVKKLALEHGIPVFQPENIKTDSKLIEETEFDFLVTAAYGQFIPLNILHTPKFITLNVHGSLLPKYRGGAPIQRAIENGDEYLGVSIMKTILKMDAGKVFKQSRIKLEDDDNYGTMIEKLATLGSNDLVDIIDKMYADFDSVEGYSQDINNVTFANNITKEDELLDFNLSANQIFNKIRAYNPSPVAYFNFKGNPYKVYDSEVVEDDSKNLPGTILSNKTSLIIKCNDNAISIKTIQAPSKNKMNIKDFLNGKRDIFEVGQIID